MRIETMTDDVIGPLLGVDSHSIDRLGGEADGMISQKTTILMITYKSGLVSKILITCL